MKRTLLLSTGLVLTMTLIPGGSAFAGGTGSGHGYGNCGSSSAGGAHDPLADGAGNGNGGHQGKSCRVEESVFFGPAIPVEPDN